LRKKNPLVPIDKQKDRKPWYITEGDAPNSSRFEPFNNSPAILSSTKHVQIFNLRKIQGRKEAKIDKYRNDSIYNPNIDYIKPSQATYIPDFKKISEKKDLSNISYNDSVDNTLV
jgi:hypothetical protein